LIWLTWYGKKTIRVIVVVIVGRWILGDGRELLVRTACWS
jgi:hypothetical protein